jgi:hypothetical protein
VKKPVLHFVRADFMPITYPGAAACSICVLMFSLLSPDLVEICQKLNNYCNVLAICIVEILKASFLSLTWKLGLNPSTFARLSNIPRVVYQNRYPPQDKWKGRSALF